VKKYLPDFFLLTFGLIVMAFLIYVIDASRNWICPLGILALATVCVTWYRHIIRLAFRSPGIDSDDEDDLPTFSG
jgi:hypothetical protein